MNNIYTASDIKKWDAYTIKSTPIDSIDLMERAATLCVKKILGSFIFSSVDIVCGLGNNGGDGLAIARLLSERGFQVTVHICHYSKNQSNDFKTNLKRLPSSVVILDLDPKLDCTFNNDLIIDCIFGIGLNKEISGWLGRIISKINQSHQPTISIDLPSGLFATDNSSNSLNHIVNASLTLTFQCPKMVFLYPEYTHFIGKFSILNIDLSPTFDLPPIAGYIKRESVQIKSRNTFAHKGSFGYLTIVGGSHGMIGAGLICAEAGFRSGAGYVGVISHSSITTPLAIRLPEAIYIGDKAEQLPKKTKAIAIGPGLGKSKESLRLLTFVLTLNHPLVIDADALNLLALNPELLHQLPPETILTPHLGELKRLIGESKSPEELLDKQKAFSQKYQVYIIQKGAYSKITTPTGLIMINSTGNPSMATAGMGDALTGIIGSLLAQGYSPLEAAKIGVFIHGLAGDLAIKKNGGHGIITSDVIKMIPTALNSF